MSQRIRYIIVLDRYAEEGSDNCFGPGHDEPPINNEEGIAQVSTELQEAMDLTGQPVGFFRVVARYETDQEIAHTVEESDLRENVHYNVALED